MNPRKITIKKLEDNGYSLKRDGANHDIYFHPVDKQMVPVQRHDFNENDMRNILKEANISD